MRDNPIHTSPWSGPSRLQRRFAADSRPAKERAPRATGLERLAEYQPMVVLAWFALYLLLGEEGFLASTVDHIDSLWLLLTVFNLPLQLVAAVVVLMLRNFGKLRAAVWIAIPSLVLLGGHVVLSFAVWAQRSLG